MRASDASMGGVCDIFEIFPNKNCRKNKIEKLHSVSRTSVNDQRFGCTIGRSKGHRPYGNLRPPVTISEVTLERRRRSKKQTQQRKSDRREKYVMFEALGPLQGQMDDVGCFETNDLPTVSDSEVLTCSDIPPGEQNRIGWLNSGQHVMGDGTDHIPISAQTCPGDDSNTFLSRTRSSYHCESHEDNWNTIKSQLTKHYNISSDHQLCRLLEQHDVFDLLPKHYRIDVYPYGIFSIFDENSHHFRVKAINIVENGVRAIVLRKPRPFRRNYDHWPSDKFYLDVCRSIWKWRDYDHYLDVRRSILQEHFAKSKFCKDFLKTTVCDEKVQCILDNRVIAKYNIFDIVSLDCTRTMEETWRAVVSREKVQCILDNVKASLGFINDHVLVPHLSEKTLARYLVTHPNHTSFKIRLMRNETSNDLDCFGSHDYGTVRSRDIPECIEHVFRENFNLVHRDGRILYFKIDTLKLIQVSRMLEWRGWKITRQRHHDHGYPVINGGSVEVDEELRFYNTTDVSLQFRTAEALCHCNSALQIPTLQSSKTKRYNEMAGAWHELTDTLVQRENRRCTREINEDDDRKDGKTLPSSRKTLKEKLIKKLRAKREEFHRQRHVDGALGPGNHITQGHRFKRSKLQRHLRVGSHSTSYLAPRPFRRDTAPTVYKMAEDVGIFGHLPKPRQMHVTSAKARSEQFRCHLSLIATLQNSNPTVLKLLKNYVGDAVMENVVLHNHQATSMEIVNQDYHIATRSKIFELRTLWSEVLGSNCTTVSVPPPSMNGTRVKQFIKENNALITIGDEHQPRPASFHHRASEPSTMTAAIATFCEHIITTSPLPLEWETVSDYRPDDSAFHHRVYATAHGIGRLCKSEREVHIHRLIIDAILQVDAFDKALSKTCPISEDLYDRGLYAKAVAYILSGLYVHDHNDSTGRTLGHIAICKLKQLELSQKTPTIPRTLNTGYIRQFLGRGASHFYIGDTATTLPDEGTMHDTCLTVGESNCLALEFFTSSAWRHFYVYMKITNELGTVTLQYHPKEGLVKIIVHKNGDYNDTLQEWYITPQKRSLDDLNYETGMYRDKSDADFEDYFGHTRLVVRQGHVLFGRKIIRRGELDRGAQVGDMMKRQIVNELKKSAVESTWPWATSKTLDNHFGRKKWEDTGFVFPLGAYKAPPVFGVAFTNKNFNAARCFLSKMNGSFTCITRVSLTEHMDPVGDITANLTGPDENVRREINARGYVSNLDTFHRYEWGLCDAAALNRYEGNLHNRVPLSERPKAILFDYHGHPRNPRRSSRQQRESKINDGLLNGGLLNVGQAQRTLVMVRTQAQRTLGMARTAYYDYHNHYTCTMRKSPQVPPESRKNCWDYFDTFNPNEATAILGPRWLGPRRTRLRNEKGRGLLCYSPRGFYVGNAWDPKDFIDTPKGFVNAPLPREAIDW